MQFCRVCRKNKVSFEAIFIFATFKKRKKSLRQRIYWRYFANFRGLCGYLGYIGGLAGGCVSFVSQKVAWVE